MWTSEIIQRSRLNFNTEEYTNSTKKQESNEESEHRNEMATNSNTTVDLSSIRSAIRGLIDQLPTVTTSKEYYEFRDKGDQISYLAQFLPTVEQAPVLITMLHKINILRIRYDSSLRWDVIKQKAEKELDNGKSYDTMLDDIKLINVRKTSEYFDILRDKLNEIKLMIDIRETTRQDETKKHYEAKVIKIAIQKQDSSIIGVLKSIKPKTLEDLIHEMKEENYWDNDEDTRQNYTAERRNNFYNRPKNENFRQNNFRNQYRSSNYTQQNQSHENRQNHTQQNHTWGNNSGISRQNFSQQNRTWGQNSRQNRQNSTQTRQNWGQNRQNSAPTVQNWGQNRNWGNHNTFQNPYNQSNNSVQTRREHTPMDTNMISEQNFRLTASRLDYLT